MLARYATGTDAASRCGHCMQLKPTYKKVAAAFKDVATVTVAAMDATANDIPEGFDVQVTWAEGRRTPCR